MPKRDLLAEAIARVAALKNVDDPAHLAKELSPLLADKSNYVVARAAELARERSVRTVLPDVLSALDRLLRAPSSKDVGCGAKSALAHALVKLEAGYDAEDILLVGVRHEHWESVWGGSADLAVSVRGNCAIALAAMGSKLAMRCAAELLTERDLDIPRERKSWSARSDAARALTMVGSDGAAAVLRFKAMIGDPEPNVLSDCLAGVITIDRDDGLEFAERFLRPTRDAASPDAEAALLAIGGSRHKSAFAVLERHARDFLGSAGEQTFLTAVALTRQDAAVEYLLRLVAEAGQQTGTAAAEVLEPLRPLAQIGERIDRARASRK